MKRNKFIIIILLLNLFAAFNFAQTPDKECECPSVSVVGPPIGTQSGELATFSASVTGWKGKVTYDWSVDQGKIVEGQGTSVIKVEKTGIVDSAITATVEIKGDWCPVCDKITDSETEPIVEYVPIRLLTVLQRPNCEEILRDTDLFFIALHNNPSDTGYIISYGSSRAVRNAENIIKNSVRLRRYDANRIVFLSGGGKDKEATLEFYLVPAGAEPPTPKEPPAASEGEEDIYENLTAETKPFIFSSEGYDVACPSSLDINGFADALKKHPKSRGNIVIYEKTKTLFRQEEKRILDFLTGQGIERKRLRTFFENVNPSSFQEGVELWFLP